MGGTYVFDSETNGFLDEGDRIHCIVAINTQSEEVFRFDPHGISKGIHFLEEADVLIAHNGVKFDYPFIRKIKPDANLPEIVDTLILSRICYPDMYEVDVTKAKADPNYALPKKLWGRHSLEAWGYRLGENKGDFGKETDWSTFTPEMMEYCEQDNWVLLALYRHLKKFLETNEIPQTCVDLEHNFATIIQRQEQRGWAFDEKTAATLYSEIAAKRQKIKESMAELFPGWWEEMKTPEYWTCLNLKAPTKTKLKKIVKDTGHDLTLKEIDALIVPGKLKKKHTPFNPGSRQHIYRVFQEKYNWKPKEFTPTGEPKVDETILKSLQYPEAEVLSEYFLLDKRLGQLAEGNQAWLRLVRRGRIFGSVNTLGAVTGRCAHSRPNVAQTPANNVPYGKEFRSLFQASKGMKLVGADASGLELRCLAHYMAHWDKGEYAKVLLEGDIHSVNQEAAGLPTRENAKTFIYGFLYGAGDTKIGEIVGSGRKAGKFLREKFLKTLPALGSLVSLVKNSASKGYIRGLDGRKLKIRSQHAALNTLLQSAGALVMKKALVIADENLKELGLIAGEDYEFVGNIHDEFQAEVKPELAEMVGEEFVKAIRSAGDFFKFNCPLDGEYKIGNSWMETH